MAGLPQIENMLCRASLGGKIVDVPKSIVASLEKSDRNSEINTTQITCRRSVSVPTFANHCTEHLEGLEVGRVDDGLSNAGGRREL